MKVTEHRRPPVAAQRAAGGPVGHRFARRGRLRFTLETRAADPEIDTRVYGPRDIDVKPAELTYQQFPSEGHRTVPNANPGSSISSSSRTAPSARSGSGPTRISLQDRMLISAAKAWHFRPATRARAGRSNTG